MIDQVWILQILDQIALKEAVVFENLGLAFENVFQHNHSFGEPGIVLPVFDIIKSFPHLDSFLVKTVHIDVVLQGDQIDGKLASSPLSIVLIVVFLFNLRLHVLQEDVDVQVLHEVSVPHLHLEWIFDGTDRLRLT